MSTKTNPSFFPFQGATWVFVQHLSEIFPLEQACLGLSSIGPALEGKIQSYVYTTQEKQVRVCSLHTRPRATLWLVSLLAGVIPARAGFTGEEGQLFQLRALKQMTR